MSDEVKERHGVVARQAGFSNAIAVSLAEGERTIYFYRPTADVEMTPAEARYLASRLYRLARRVEKRVEEEK